MFEMITTEHSFSEDTKRNHHNMHLDLSDRLLHMGPDPPAMHDSLNDDIWSNSPQFQPHTASSPRQRTGFSRSVSDLSGTNTPSFGPFLQGLPSPSLPVLSPDAPSHSKRLYLRGRRKRKDRWLASLDSQACWVGLYFSLNLGLTLYNKGVLVRFPFPYTLTALHALCGTIGGFVLLRRGAYTPKQLSLCNHIALAAFSVLYAVNIAVSNVSLHLVTVPFHQVVRASTPIFTIVLSSFLLETRMTHTKLITLCPVILGVAFATYGDYYFTAWGLFLTLFGTLLAALKTIYTNVLQSSPTSDRKQHTLLPPRLSLQPLDLLMHTSPLAFVQCIIYAQMTGELERVRHYSTHALNWRSTAILLGNGCIALALNIVSLTANAKIGALSMTVAANVKQVLTILFAVVLFDLAISPMNALGICLTLAGGAWYAWIEYIDRVSMKNRKRDKSQFNRRVLS